MSSELPQKIQEQASQCVKCGLCLPHCPTYRLTQNECESPRGRIAMMNGLAQNQLPLTKSLKTYLDHCLQCQFCESACPAQVPFANLLDNTKAFLNKNKPLPFSLKLLAKPSFLKALFYILKFYQLIGLQKFFKKFSLLKIVGLDSLNTTLPELPSFTRFKAYYPPLTTERGQVGLLMGCIQPLVDPSTLLAVIKTLTFYGYGVHIPQPQVCCGAIYQHSGYPQKAEELYQKNSTLFKDKQISALISAATGCAASLSQQNYQVPVYEITAFLKQLSLPAELTIQPLKKKVLLHTPCTLKNGLKHPETAFELLNKIPQLEIEALPLNQCCGASGLNLVKFPEFSTKLIQSTISSILSQKADYLLTTNVGCWLQFSRSLNSQNRITITHPLVLFAQQLIFKKQL